MRPGESEVVPASFRDPAGFLFRRGGVLYRQINEVGSRDYRQLMKSGLYDELAGEGLLVPHREVYGVRPAAPGAFRIIRPQKLSFISYPYEWSFGQLKEAALLTLEIERRALNYGMRLKDASAFNVQYTGSSPVFIDTLSFERHQEGEPWAAYRQFCRHFLAPLAVMAYRDVRLIRTFRQFIDGFPLDMASGLLPRRSWLSFGLLAHLHLHALSGRFLAGRRAGGGDRKMGSKALGGLIDSLEGAVRRLRWQPGDTTWDDYYSRTNYSWEAFAHKKQLVDGFLQRIEPDLVWDLGANTGVFSLMAADCGARTLAIDSDPSCVERLYQSCREENMTDVLPLYIDIRNPSPGLGWVHRERSSLLERGPADMLFMLALIHHLVIAGNLPLARIAEFAAGIADWAVIEFVPRKDSQIKEMLAGRNDLFGDYTRENFTVEFRKFFSIEAQARISDSKRWLYLMKAGG